MYDIIPVYYQMKILFVGGYHSTTAEEAGWTGKNVPSERSAYIELNFKLSY